MVRRARGVKGMVLTAVGALLLVLWLGSAMIPMLMMRGGPRDPAGVIQTTPVVLLAISLMTLLTSTGGKGIMFTAAETDFLFPGPFSRRQIILYRLMRTGLASLFGAFFMGIGLRQFSISWIGTYSSAVLLLLYLQVFSITAALLMQVISERMALSRVRWVVIACGVGIVLAALYFAPVPSLEMTTRPSAESLKPLLDIRDSVVTQTLASPFRPFAYAMTAPTWGALLWWSAVSAGVVGVTLLLALWLDADYLEASARTSAAFDARLAQARRGKVTFATGSSRLRMPTPPRLGGAGAIFWRQGTTALRSMKGVLILLFFFGLGMAPFLIIKGISDPTGPVIGFLVMFTFVGAGFFQFDFRGDVDHIDTLKALPMSPMAVVVGELLTPMVLIGGFQATLLAGLAMLRPERAEMALFAMAFTPLVAMLFATIENTAFLLYPRRSSSAPGDLSAMARGLLMMAAKIAFLGAAVLLSLGVGTLALWLTGSNLVSMGLAWLTAAGVALGTIPLVAWAFVRYDVSADTSPNS